MTVYFLFLSFLFSSCCTALFIYRRLQFLYIYLPTFRVYLPFVVCSSNITSLYGVQESYITLRFVYIPVRC